jgi:hypothetical protein
MSSPHLVFYKSRTIALLVQSFLTQLRNLLFFAKYAQQFSKTLTMLDLVFISFARAVLRTIIVSCKYTYNIFSKKICPICRTQVTSHRMLRNDHKMSDFSK